MPVLFTAVLVVLVTMLKLRKEQSPQLKTWETGLILVQWKLVTTRRAARMMMRLA